MKIKKINENLQKRLFLSGDKRFFCSLSVFLVANFLLVFFLRFFLGSSLESLVGFIYDYKFYSFLFFSILLIYFWFLLSPISLLRLQFRRNRPSWIWYLIWLVLFLPLYIAILFDVTTIIEIVFMIFVLFLMFVFSFLKEKKDKQKRFAFDAIGAKDDGLNFKKHVNGFIKSLDSLEDSVLVLSLFGDLGHGKSSFLRMAIEKMNEEEFLYTYISLTETNEAKDFSQLFSERWRETLTERYPSIDIVSASNMLKPIIREVGSGFFSSIIEFIEKFNKQIIKSKVVFNHTISGSSEEYLDKETAKVFGYVDKFFEGKWIIVIDELERSKRDEIYRAIEIIERFKSLGINGLPIQIIFIICTSEKDLKELLVQNPGEPSKQIGDFFFSNPKTFSNYEFIPYPSWEKMIRYIQLSLLNIRKDKKFKKLFDKYEKFSLKPRFPETTISGFKVKSDKFNQEEVLDIVTLLMAKESPRLTSKIVSDLTFVTTRLSVTSMIPGELLPFPFSHMLLLSYIRVKYPELFVFLHETIDDVFRTTQDKIYENMYKSLDDKDKKLTFEKWFKTIRGNSNQQYDWTLLEHLVSIISYEYSDFLKNERKDYLEDYVNHEYFPYGLLRYLRAVNGLQLPEDADFVVLLKEYQDKKDLGVVASDEESLYLFAKNSRRIYSLKSELHISISEEIIKRIKDGTLSIKPRKIRESIYMHLVYEFLFHLNEAVKKVSSKKSKKYSIITEKIGKLLNSFFKEPSISLGAKFTLLNSLVKESRSSQIHWDLDDLMKKLLEKNIFSIQNAVDMTMNHFKKKYIDNKGNIYENEENYFYVLYQYWSGGREDNESIKLIRTIASRGLDKFPDALKMYWDLLPYNDEEDVEDIFTENYIWRNSGDLHPYVTIPTLINKSKKASFKGELKRKMDYWIRAGKNGEKKYLKAMPMKEGDTLMKALIAKGFVK